MFIWTILVIDNKFFAVHLREQFFSKFEFFSKIKMENLQNIYNELI